MYNATATMYGEKMINRAKCGLEYIPIVNTTLNEKFGILPFENNPDMFYPKINLLTIGAGLRGTDNTATRLNLMSSPHSPIDAALFEHIPFYIRKTSEVDIYPPSPKLKLKKTMLIDSIEYTVYYGYEVTNYEAKDDILTFTGIENEYVNISSLNLSELDVLNPTPKANVDLTTIIKNYVSDFIKIYTLFSTSELNEIINAFNIIKPGEPPIIKEVGVCFSKTFDTGNNYIENIQTQIMYFLDVDENLNDALEVGKLDFYIELGNMKMVVI